MQYEVIIIGCGPAGLSSAIYLGRANINTLVIGKKKQSQVVKAHLIENYFGFPEGISGIGLLEKGIKQAKKFKVKIIDNEVVDIKKLKNSFRIKLSNNEIHNSKIVIMATGTPIRLSGIKNEEEFTGKGVHYCIDCDGAFYRNKNVAIIGNSNHAAEDCIDLSVYTRNITVISNSDKFDFSEQMKNVIEKNKIKLINKKVTEFKGDKFLNSIKLEDQELKFDGVFMACGTTSALDFASELGLEIQNNILVVDNNNKTNIDGIFAAGNCCARCRQVAKNVGDGCNAALSAIKYLRNQEVYTDYSGGG